MRLSRSQAVSNNLLSSDSPVFVKQPKDVTGDSGERVSLECLVDSNPPGQYSWVRNSLGSSSKVSEKQEKEFVKLNPICGGLTPVENTWMRNNPSSDTKSWSPLSDQTVNL